VAIAIANALILADADGTPRPGAILVEGRRIAGIAYGAAEAAALAARAHEVHDAKGAIALPAFVNAHHHCYGNLLRGTEDDLPLELWALFTVAWGRALDARFLRLAILAGAAEMLRAGYAAVVDHAPQLGLRAAAIAAHRESGMRVAYAPMLHDLHDHDLLGFDLPPHLRRVVEGAGFASHDAVAAAIGEAVAATRGDGRVRLLLGPNAPQRCSPELLALWASLRDRHGLGVHAHLLETRAQAILARRLWPDGMVADLARRGLLAPGLSVAHGVWTSADDRDVLARHGVVVVHNPASNLMLGSGAIPFLATRDAGIEMALGSDSANTGGRADPFEIMRLAAMLPRIAQSVAPDAAPFRPTARDVLRLATQGGAAVLGLAREAGCLAPGRLADIVLVSLAGAGMAALEPSVDLLVRHGSPSSVIATMVDGTWAYRAGRIEAFDEAAVLGEIAHGAAELHARAAAERAAAGEAARVLAPQLRRLHDAGM
jgi:cytosine/adenosine deaminase-related metal-dependent hydrolase